MPDIKIKRYADKENLKKLMKYSKDTFANKSEINENYYTKEQVDTMLEGFSGGGGTGGTGGDYYTKSEIDTKLTSKANTSDLATVATSGSYTDLANKPAIPTVNNATLTIQKNGTTVKTFTANASADVTANITVPTKVSELTNDSRFLTSHQSLSNYVTLNGAQTISGAKTFTGNIIGINKEKSTEDANNLYPTTTGSKLTYYTTTNGGTTLTNVPAGVNTILESRTIRRLSDSDWVVEQICHNSNGLYYRKGSNGTWGAWKTFAFTDSNISGNDATESAYVQTGEVDQTVAGTKTFSKPIVGSVTGNAATATKLATARTIALSGAATGTATDFDGSDNITIPVTALSPSAIRDQWYAAYPDGFEAHNAMWGGRDITAAFDSGEFSEHIYDGTFKDIFPGDYITKQITIPKVRGSDGTTIFDGDTYTVDWVIADCNYWPNVLSHHVVIVPRVHIFDARMNPTNTTEGGYAGSEMYKKIIPACATGIVNAFGSDHILTFRDSITKAVNTSSISSGVPFWTGASSEWDWYDVQCNLMSEAMVYDGPHYASSAFDNITAIRQMSAFRLSGALMNDPIWGRPWWLRDVVSSSHFATVYGYTGIGIYADVCGASDADVGVRPFALLR